MYAGAIEPSTRGADHITMGRLLDSNEALRRLESRPRAPASQLRLGIDREHEAQAFGQGADIQI